MLNLAWVVQVQHSYHEANACVDVLVKHGHVLPVGLHVFSTLPSFSSVAFVVDMSRTVRPPVISVSFSLGC